MPNTLPVPSKAALRTLRNLALGTTCTVAFSAGVLAADRRRRIHTAKRVRDNAKKLKSTKQYHGVSAASTDSYEPEVTKYGDIMWKSREPERATTKSNPLPSWNLSSSSPPTSDPAPRKESCEPKQSSVSEQPVQRWQPAAPAIQKSKFAMETARKQTKNRRTSAGLSELPELAEGPQFLNIVYTRLQGSKYVGGLNPLVCTRVPDAPWTSAEEVRDRQQSLAQDVMSLLAAGEGKCNVDAATKRFLDVFEEGILIDEYGFQEELTEAAVKLSQACRDRGKLEEDERILDVVVSYNWRLLEPETFMKFRPSKVIRALMSDVNNRFDTAKLEKACSLYTTKLKPGTRSGDLSQTDRRDMAFLGNELCHALYHRDMFATLKKVHATQQRYGGDATAPVFDLLIMAAHRTSQHHKVAKYFRKFYAKIPPSNQHEFSEITRVVAFSILELPGFNIEDLFTMMSMAERGELRISTILCMQMLRQEFIIYRDIGRAKATFERFEPLFHVTHHPEQLYAQIIQNCVEADDETAALHYHEQFKKLYGTDFWDVRISGHLAHAKARRQDWTGVREDFLLMKNMEPRQQFDFKKRYDASFTPILRRFSESHSITETEIFIREYVDDLGVRLTCNSAQVIIQKCLEVKEIDSVSRWLDYLHSTGGEISPNFFSSLLISCVKQWRFSFKEVLHLFLKVSNLGDWTHKFIHDNTYSTLQRLASKPSRGNPAAALQRLEDLRCAASKFFNTPSNNPSPTDAIKLALATGDPSKALALYEQALDMNLPLLSGTLPLAVRASLQLYPSAIHKSLALLQTNNRKGQDVQGAMAAIVHHQISVASHENQEDSIQTARRIMSVLEREPRAIPGHVVSCIMAALRRQENYQLVVDFWDYVSCRKDLPAVPLDDGKAVMLLQAYLKLKSSKGLRRLLNMMRERGLAPSDTFKRGLKRARNWEAKALGHSEGTQGSEDFLQGIKDAVAATRDLATQCIEVKKSVKEKIMLIMEKAIEVDMRKKDLLDGDIHSVGRPWADVKPGLSLLEPAESWMDSDDEDYGPDLRPEAVLWSPVNDFSSRTEPPELGMKLGQNDRPKNLPSSTIEDFPVGTETPEPIPKQNTVDRPEAAPWRLLNLSPIELAPTTRFMMSERISS